MTFYLFVLLALLGSCLLLTVIIELVVALALGVRKAKDLVLTILANAITNPLVELGGLFINDYYSQALLPYIIVAELLAIFVEYRIYLIYGQNIKNPFILSLVANLISFATGIVIASCFI